MDSLPDEILCKFVAYLSETDLWICRLLSFRWNLIATERVRRVNGKVRIWNEDRLIRFNETFDSCINLPFKTFDFNLLYEHKSTEPFQQFGNRFGPLVEEYCLMATSKELNDDEVSFLMASTKSALYCVGAKVYHFLSNAQNLVKLDIYMDVELGHCSIFPVSPGLRHCCSLPVFSKLSTVSITFAYINPILFEGAPSFLDELSQRTPALTVLEFSNFKVHQGFKRWSFAKKLPRILHYFCESNAYVTLSLNINSEVHRVFKGLVESNLPKIGVVHFKLDSTVRLSSFSRTKLGSNISRLLAEQNENLKSIDIDITGHVVEIELPYLPSLKNICINLTSQCYQQFGPGQFPKLETMAIVGLENEEIFSACVWHNLTQLHLSAKQGVNPTICKESTQPFAGFPKVEKLWIDIPSNEIRFSLGFPRLVDLSLNLSEREWEVLTGGAPTIPDDQILTFQMSPHNKQTFGYKNEYACLANLTGLKLLTIRSCSLESMKALIYLNRTLQLNRLRSLILDLSKDPAAQITTDKFKTELQCYHDEVSVRVESV